MLRLCCHFMKVLVNIWYFFCFLWLMTRGKTVSLDFTYITSVIASTERLTSHLQLWIVWNLVFNWRKKCDLKCFHNNFNSCALLTKLHSVNFCNLSLFNSERFHLKTIWAVGYFLFFRLALFHQLSLRSFYLNTF